MLNKKNEFISQGCLISSSRGMSDRRLWKGSAMVHINNSLENQV